MDPTLLVVVVGAGVLGAGAGALVNRVAGRFPWPAGSRARDLVAPGSAAVRPPLLEAGTAALLAATALGVGLAWALPAFLLLAVAGVLLAVIDLRHRLLPNRVVLPTLVSGAALLLLAALADGAAAVVPVLPVVDTTVSVDGDGVVTGTLSRGPLRRVQTPQGFSCAVLADAYDRLAAGVELTDDAAVVRAAGVPVATVAGDERAAKVTVPHDLALAELQIAR